MHSWLITSFAILFLYSLLAVGTPANPDESLHTPVAIDDSAKSDPVNGVHALHERHKRHHNWEDENIGDYSGDIYKRQIDDESFVAPEQKREYNDEAVTRAHSVGGQHEQHHFKSVPLVPQTQQSRRDYHDEAVTRVHGGGKRHEHHHTTTAPPVQEPQPLCLNVCDCLAPVASVSCVQSQDSAGYADDRRDESNHLGKRHERTTTSRAQQTEGSCDAACQAAHNNQERDVGNENASHGPSHEIPSSRNLPTATQTPPPSVVKRHHDTAVITPVKQTPAPSWAICFYYAWDTKEWAASSTAYANDVWLQWYGDYDHAMKQYNCKKCC